MKEPRSQIAGEVAVVIASRARDPGSSGGRRTPRFLVAFAPRNDGGCVCQQSFWRRTLILGAVLSLTISVATRYGAVVRHETGTIKIVASQSLDAKRQHLLNDGFHWSAPAATFVLFAPARVSASALPGVAPITRLYSGDVLYGRPPPYC